MKNQKITAFALVGILTFSTISFSGFLGRFGRIDDHLGDLLDSDGELIGTWKVSHATSNLRLLEVSPEDASEVPDILLYLIGNPPQDALEKVQYTFYENNTIIEEQNGRISYITYEYDEEAKELMWSAATLVDDEPIDVSFSYTGERMSWTQSNIPGYLVFERVS